MGVDIRGLDDLRAQLRNLAPELDAEAGPIVQDAAQKTADLTISDYPEVTGALKRGVRVRKVSELTYVVEDRAPHAHLYEKGTVTRTTRGSGANRGVMPAHPTMIPHAIRQRGLMVEQLKAMVRKHGAEVSERDGD